METISMNDFNNHKIKEETVIQRILDGEKELYEMLVRRNNQKLYRIIRGYLKNETEIEDVMQNSYIKAYTKLHQFNLQSQFSTWLIRIAINESLAELKKKGKILYLNSYRQSTDNNFILEFPDYKQLNPQEKMTQKEGMFIEEDETVDMEEEEEIVAEEEPMGLMSRREQ